MLSHDSLGLIADLDHLRPASALEDAPELPQESYILLPLGLGTCERCVRVRPLTVVLGVPGLAVCAACDPADAATVAIEASFAFEDADDWVLI